jgi:PIN domain nuclease of toxin-antitoxin system
MRLLLDTHTFIWFVISFARSPHTIYQLFLRVHSCHAARS